MAVKSNIAFNLHKIGLGEPVNAQSLCNALYRLGHHYTQVEKVFGYREDLRGKQVVRVLDQSLFHTLCQQYPTSHLESRTHAALTGDSHRVNLSGCVAVIDELARDNPHVCIVRGESISFPRPIGDSLLVVENEELFLQKPALTDFLNQYCGFCDMSGWDLLLGAGNRSTSKYHALIYKQYSQVACLLDPDLGGMRIFRAILGILPPQMSLQFVLPNNIDELMSQQKARLGGRSVLTSAQRKEVVSNEGIHPDIDRLASLILKHSVLLEQEVYLSLSLQHDQ